MEMELVTLSGTSLKVYLGLLAAQQYPGRRSHRTLSRHLHLSRTTVRRAVQELQQRGWLAGGPGAWQVSPAPLAALFPALAAAALEVADPAPSGPRETPPIGATAPETTPPSPPEKGQKIDPGHLREVPFLTRVPSEADQLLDQVLPEEGQILDPEPEEVAHLLDHPTPTPGQVLDHPAAAVGQRLAPPTPPLTRARTSQSSSSEEDVLGTPLLSSPGGVGGEIREPEKKTTPEKQGEEKRRLENHEKRGQETTDRRSRDPDPTSFLQQMQALWQTIAPEPATDAPPWFQRLHDEFGPQLPVQVFQQFVATGRPAQELRFPHAYFRTCCRNAHPDDPPPGRGLSRPGRSRARPPTVAAPASVADQPPDMEAFMAAYRAEDARRDQEYARQLAPFLAAQRARRGLPNYMSMPPSPSPSQGAVADDDPDVYPRT